MELANYSCTTVWYPNGRAVHVSGDLVEDASASIAGEPLLCAETCFDAHCPSTILTILVKDAVNSGALFLSRDTADKIDSHKQMKSCALLRMSFRREQRA